MINCITLINESHTMESMNWNLVMCSFNDAMRNDDHAQVVQQGAINTLRLRQNGQLFPDDILKYIFLNTNVRIPIKSSMTFAPGGPICNIPAFVQMMACSRPGNKPLSEPMMVNLLNNLLNKRSWYQCLMFMWHHKSTYIITLRPRQNGPHFTADSFLKVQLTIFQHWFG